MRIVVGATFGNAVNAHDAISDLRGFGLDPNDISVGELNPAGMMFGTATTMIPGTGGFSGNTRSDRLFPGLHRSGISPAMPEGVVAESTGDALQMLLDIGLPEDLARKAGQAILGGGVLVVAGIAPAGLVAVGGLLLKNNGVILPHDD